METQPRISVIVPCYNQGKYLDEALNSVYQQSFPQWECIVVNDGSTDDTEYRALNWLEKDERFRYVQKKNGGLSSARNKGLGEAKGSFIQFLDADDLLEADKFLSSLEYAENVDIVITNFNMFTVHAGVKTYFSLPFNLNSIKFDFENLLTGWEEKFVIPIHCGLFKRELYNDVRFEENLQSREDWLMWLQLLRSHATTSFIDKPFALYRASSESMSQNSTQMNKSLVQAYKLIYEITPDEYKHCLFLNAVEKLGSLLAKSEDLILRTRQSHSYQLGNFFIRKLSAIKRKVDGN